MAWLRVHPHELTGGHILPFVPAGPAAEQIKESDEIAAEQEQALPETPSERLRPRESTPTLEPVSPEEIITVVSGLPRSGTSMMMQTPQAGGIAPLTRAGCPRPRTRPEIS